MTFNIKSRQIALFMLLFLSFSLLTFKVAAYREASQGAQGSNQQQSIIGPLLELRASDENNFTFVAPPASVVVPSNSQTATIEVTYNGFSPEAEDAFQYAVEIWEAQLTSPVTIRVNATWQSLPSGVLGSAGPYLIANFPDAPLQNVWYPRVIADQFAGTDIDPGQPDIQAFFNSDFPNWYFGTDGQTPSNQYDFVTVVLHELGHGLGFTGSAAVSGGQGSWGDNTFGYPYIYDLFVENGFGESITDTSLFPNPSTELAAQLQGYDLFFNSSTFMRRNQGSLPKLYAPATWQSGSSYAHLDEDEYPAGNADSLMTPQLGQAEAIHHPGAITLGIFNDMGWTIDETATATPSNTPLVSSTPTMTVTLTATATMTATLSATPTVTATSTITATPTVTATNTPTNTPTRTPTSTPSKTPTYTPTSTPTIPSWKLYLPIIIRAAASPTATPSPTASPTQTSGQGHPFESEVITLSNQERSKVGCPALTFNEQLRTAAIKHSTDMALNDFFDHTGSDGSLPWDRIEDTDYEYSTAAENIAAGYSSPQAVINGWMNSQGHRENILNCKLREIGVGYYYLQNDTGETNYNHYWTQVFASPLNRSPSKGKSHIPH